MHELNIEATTLCSNRTLCVAWGPSDKGEVGRKRDTPEVEALRKRRGAFVRARRKALDLNQTQLASRCTDVTPSMVSRIEGGTMNGGWPLLADLAHALGVPLDDLLVGRDSADARNPQSIPLDGVVLPDGLVLSPSAAARSGLATPPRPRALPEPELLPVSAPVDGFAVRLALEAPVQLGGDQGPAHDLRPGDVLVLRWLERDELAPEGALVYATRAEEDGTVVAGELRLFFVARRIPRLAGIVGDNEVKLVDGWKVEAIVVEQRRKHP